MTFPKFKIAELVVALLLVTVAASADMTCSDVMADYHGVELSTKLKRMFQLAALQEWVFDQSSVMQECKSGDGAVLADPPVVVQSVDPFSEMAASATFQSWFEGFANAALLESDGPRYHLTCHGPLPTVELAIRLDVMDVSVYQSGEGKLVAPTPHVLMEVDVVVPKSFIPQSILDVIPEELEVAEATIVDSNNPDGHTKPVVLIRGTDLSSDHIWPQLSASLKGVLESSCVFPAASMLVTMMRLRRGEDPRFLLTGSSLGGTAVQHVAIYQRLPWGFDAYSFNGLGVPKSVAASNDPGELLTSYTVEGDWINWLRWLFGQEEAGKIWRYDPKNIFWRMLKGRHSIEAVRNSLCACLKGEGGILIP